MHRHREYCIAALVLMAASLLMVALDRVVLPQVEHKPGSCPICSWANSLASAAVPPVVIWVVETHHCWTPNERPYVVCAACPSRPFFARGPPAIQAT